MHRNNLIVFLWFFGASFDAQAQQGGAIQTIINYQWTVFVLSDTSYRCTKFINQEGKFWFRRNFIDSSLVNKSKTDYIFDNKSSDHARLLKYQFVDTIDSVFSSFIRDHKYPDSASVVKIKKGQELTIVYVEDVLLDDLRFSYILGVLDQEMSDKYIYVLYTEEESYPLLNSYSLLKLQPSSGISKRLYIYEADSKDLNGIRLVKRDSVIINEKDSKKINKKLKCIENFNSVDCLRPGVPWLLMYAGNLNVK